MRIVDRLEKLALLSKTKATSAAIVMTIAAFSTMFLAAQEKKKPEWKDPAEYDLYKSITQSQDPKVWLEALDKWSKQYPQSEYSDLRRKAYLAAYRQLNRPRDAFNAAAECVKDNPTDLVALSAIVGYVYQLQPVSPSDLDTAEKASSAILSNLDAIYSKDNRPSEMSDADAAKAKPEMRAFAQKTIGWIYFTRKEWNRAETELTKALELDPKQAQVSDWLGRAILAQNKTNPEKQPLALFQFARASSYEGPGALPASDRQQLQSYLIASYKKYHGSDEGLAQLVSLARSNAIPPSGFAIKSSVQMDREQAEAQKLADKANPDKALWRDLKVALTGPNGESYFESSVKDALLPGGAEGVTKLKGKLVSMSPSFKPKELIIAIENPAGDATLKLDNALPGRMEAGSEIEFEGIARGFAKEPFGIIFDVEKAKIAGWTGKNDTQKKSAGAKKSALNNKTPYISSK